MQYTPLERRERLYRLIRQDEDCQKIGQEYLKAQESFIHFVDHLPRWVRQRFWAFPGAIYLMSTRILAIVTREMRFPDET